MNTPTTHAQYTVTRSWIAVRWCGEWMTEEITCAETYGLFDTREEAQRACDALRARNHAAGENTCKDDYRYTYEVSVIQPLTA